MKKEEEISQSEIKYVDYRIGKAPTNVIMKALCNFMFDLLNGKGILRAIFDRCDARLCSFRFKRMMRIEEDMRFVKNGVPSVEEDEILEFKILDEEAREDLQQDVIRIPKSQYEAFKKIVRVDDWVEGELSICFWAIEKYLDLNARISFVEFLRVYLTRERYHFLLEWYYRELLGRDVWLLVQGDRFTKDHSGLLRLHEKISNLDGLTVEQKYDLDIITFLDFKAEEDLSNFLAEHGISILSSGLFTPGGKEFRRRMPVVIDANIMVSALVHYSSSTRESADVKVFRLWTKRDVEVLTSPQILEEYEKLLKRKKSEIERKGIAFNWLDLLKGYSKIVVPSIKLDIVKDDPEDNKYFECAVKGRAKSIISRDKHLLNVGEYNGVKVIRPNEFLRELE
jgi:hypothetical protein